MKIPDAVVEVAAAAHLHSRGDATWGDLTKRGRDDRLNWMRAALEAAAPHMLAGYVEAKPPEHQCEPWQLQANGRVAFRSCSACGENQE